MAGIKIDPEMLDIYMELLNKLMAGSETDGGNARLEVSGAGKTEDGLVRYNEEVNKLGDDLRELYGNEGEILGRIRDGTLFKNADKVSVVARSTDDAGVLAKHADEAAAWLHGGKVFRYSDETAEAVASGEKLLKESGTIYESFADMMSPEDAKRYLDFLENGSREGLTGAELAGVEKADALLVSQKVEYEDVWDLRNAGDLLESGKYSTQISPEMEKKILEGQRKSPVKNEVIGGHSPQINNSNDLFAVEELSVNADGTRNIKFVKDLQDGSISKIKKSTVFPDSWSDSKIIDTIKEVGDSPFISVRGRDGATWHRKIVDGVEVDVIKLGNDVISGYPTGKINAPKPSGF